MRYMYTLILLIFTPGVWADVEIRVVDQNDLPVEDAIIVIPTISQSTPDNVAIMDQVDSTFVPHVLVIQKGQNVSFPNSDNIRHHVYSFSKPKTFEIKLYKGVTPPILFDQPGMVVLGCNIHDDMIGYIYVSDNVYVVKTDERGIVQVPDAVKGTKIILWSERLPDGVNSQKDLLLTHNEIQTIKLDLTPPVRKAHQSHYTY